MAVTVTMLQTRRGEDGTLWTAGSSYSASDAFAQFLITGNLATGSLPGVSQSGLSPADTIALKGVVSGTGSIAITHDGSGRVASVTKAGGRGYTYAYPAGQIQITASDGAVATATLDGSNRVTGLAGNF